MNDISATTFNADADRIQQIGIVPAILEVICRTTGMGFAAVARVTPERWIAMEVLDNVKFGLMAGGELVVETTICHEIRQSGKEVVIDHVAEDEFYRHHHTPKQYGLQSYISVPVKRGNGSFFGTLCAIDPSPHVLSTPQIIAMFRTYAALIAFHLDAAEQLGAGEAQQLADRSKLTLRQQLLSLSGEDLQGPSVDGAAAYPMLNRHSKKFIDALQQIPETINSLLHNLKGTLQP